MRRTTERPEAVEAGAARLVGTETHSIVEGVARLLSDPADYAACQVDRNPYGDGHAAERIVELMLREVREWRSGGMEEERRHGDMETK
jgi:UDP-N-acetylglucosamine 2-epimerase (non-hydrolysing)